MHRAASLECAMPKKRAAVVCEFLVADSHGFPRCLPHGQTGWASGAEVAAVMLAWHPTYCGEAVPVQMPEVSVGIAHGVQPLAVRPEEVDGLSRDVAL